ncbi:putative short-chain dehydrogenase [Neohortaea acidophila]|uniref:Putative short-chain dehydrogenase n=1 Tax=Neohortaea acidophila TaxID=245834 RepID=A0A6A6Q2K8_9PEZI|nr:putative short-chain dehydrogenase [Neohortaea acidophila]KAF2486224.1 putative short-chain dehydrogenase [Neohortaea acidophila]
MSSYMATLPRPTKTYHSQTYDRISVHHAFSGKGKSVLISGGASGLGYEMSKAFARAGVARIAIVSRSLDAQKVKSDFEAAYPDVEILPYQASITDHARMAQVLGELGTIDVLVLNAAFAHGRGNAMQLSLEEVQESFNVNTIAAFSVTQAYLAMPAPQKKTVINVSSAAAHMTGSRRVAYGASKAAGAQLMQSFASAFPDGDIRIFSFHPGAYYTPGVAKNIPKDMMVWEDERLPADFTLWLAGEESDFLHGRHVWANYDVDELIALKEKLRKDPDFLTIGLVGL